MFFSLQSSSKAQFKGMAKALIAQRPATRTIGRSIPHVTLFARVVIPPVPSAVLNLNVMFPSRDISLFERNIPPEGLCKGDRGSTDMKKGGQTESN